MRIIKLSPDDPEMKTRESVSHFFHTTLKERNPRGQFLLTKGRISPDGIRAGERIVFTYNGDCVFLAKSASDRLDTQGPSATRYPTYFCVDVDSIVSATGTLSDLEKVIWRSGIYHSKIVRTMGWPKIEESEDNSGIIESILEDFEQ